VIVVAAGAAFHALKWGQIVADNLSPEARKRAMSAVKSTNTSPERAVRSAIHKLGYRFRLHGPKLPGKPDLVLARRKLAIFVHGCYWHGHACARGNRLPKTNVVYWKKKIGGNVARDKKRLREYRKLGWRTLVIWECRIRHSDFEAWIARKLSQFK
jgi:DNA mismatch endonuclease (patch repair protein)